MKKTMFSLLALLVLLIPTFACNKSCSGKGKPATPPTPAKESAPAAPSKDDSLNPFRQDMDELMKNFDLKAGDKLYAEFNTSMGPLKVELYWEKAPMTVRNFVELALGQKEWLNPKTQEKTTAPLYNGTIFHRVIKNFMIQGGDPLGSGFGGPGYKFKDEFNPQLRHNAKGILSMANSGPNSNGSQFFITEGPTPHLDNRHSVFGQVHDTQSLELITKIASVKTVRDKPVEDIVINTIKITKG